MIECTLKFQMNWFYHRSSVTYQNSRPDHLFPFFYLYLSSVDLTPYLFSVGLFGFCAEVDTLFSVWYQKREIGKSNTVAAHGTIFKEKKCQRF